MIRRIVAIASVASFAISAGNTGFIQLTRAAQQGAEVSEIARLEAEVRDMDARLSALERKTIDQHVSNDAVQVLFVRTPLTESELMDLRKRELMGMQEINYGLSRPDVVAR